MKTICFLILFLIQMIITCACLNDNRANSNQSIEKINSNSSIDTISLNIVNFKKSLNKIIFDVEFNNNTNDSVLFVMAKSEFIMPTDYPDSTRQAKFKLPFATGLLLKDNFGKYIFYDPPGSIETDDTNSCYHTNNIPQNLMLQRKSKMTLKYTMNFNDFMNDSVINKILKDSKSVSIVTSYLDYSDKNTSKRFIFLFSNSLNW